MPLSSKDVRTAARLLAAADRDGTLLQGLPTLCRPTSLADGYAIQDVLVEELGLKPAGWKIGLTNAQAQRSRGLDHPVRARLFAPRIAEAPARVPAPAGRLMMLEAEFIFRVGRDMPARVESSRLDVLNAIDSIHIGVELCASRYAPGLPPDVAVNLADNSFHGGLVVGPAIRGWRSIELSTVQVDLFFNGAKTATGSGAEVMGDPVNALVWLADSLGREGRPLSSGDWIASGTCTGATPVSPGTAARALFHGLGHLDIVLDPKAQWPGFELTSGR